MAHSRTAAPMFQTGGGKDILAIRFTACLHIIVVRARSVALSVHSGPHQSHAARHDCYMQQMQGTQ